jgi:hypothetical protein
MISDTAKTVAAEGTELFKIRLLRIGKLTSIRKLTDAKATPARRLGNRREPPKRAESILRRG